MKALYTLLLLLFISQYKSESCDSQTAPTTVKDCKERDAGKKKHKCCKMDYKFKDGTEKTYCQALTKKEYEGIIEYLRNDVINNGGEEKVENANIDCSSGYVVVSILSLILLFI